MAQFEHAFVYSTRLAPSGASAGGTRLAGGCGGVAAGCLPG